MIVQHVKAAVDAGKSVHWANEGYVVHKDRFGQYLITFRANTNTVGLTGANGVSLYEDSDLFFISRPDLGHTVHCGACQSHDVQRQCWATWNAELQMWEVGQFEDKAFCEGCQSEVDLISRPVREYITGARSSPEHAERTVPQQASVGDGKGESRLSVGGPRGG